MHHYAVWSPWNLPGTELCLKKPRVQYTISSQYLGFVKFVKILDLPDHMCVVRVYMNFGLRGQFIHHRNVVQHMSKIDDEGRTVEGLALYYVVNEVNYHPCSHLEWKSQNCVNRDIGTCPYGE